MAARLRDLQLRLEALAAHVERIGETALTTTGDDAAPRIIIVRTPPERPQLPEPRRDAAPPAAPEPHRRSGVERRAGTRDRRARHDRRRRLRRDPRPPALRTERRLGAEDRRCGRGDRRLGDDRRRATARTASRRPRRAPRVLLAIGLQLAFWATVVAALVVERS